MKKIILLFFLLSVFVLQAQVSIPNGGFENWTTTTYSYPANYDFNSNSSDGLFNLNKTTGYTGNYGVELKTVLNDGVRMAFMLNETPPSEDPTTWHGGIPYNQIPTGLQGYYKYNVASGDLGMAIIVFSKNGVNIGTYYYTLGGLHTNYTAFNFTFSPALSVTPDSVIVAFASSGFSGAQEGSTLIVDNISFTGVTSQPELLSGDFEQWTDVTTENLVAWNADYDDHNIHSIKTTDTHSGNYAVELKTYLAEHEDQPAPQSAQVMNGYYSDNCNGNCYPLGGSPFNNQTDVLEFYYKYQPAGTDHANVGLYFKKKGSGMDGWYGGADLYASSAYKYAEVPINLPFVPDSIIIQFQSSNWNTISMANIGSTLKIDDIIFRSQKTGINDISAKEVTFYPNPADKGFYLPKDLIVDEITISDIRGAKILNSSDVNNYVDVSNLPKGIYIVRLQTKEGVYIGKLMKK